MKKPSHNACAVIDAIKVEYDAAHEQDRYPSSLNVLAIFRERMNPPLGGFKTEKLFQTVFNAYLE
jgi:hypothetical protein